MQAELAERLAAILPQLSEKVKREHTCMGNDVTPLQQPRFRGTLEIQVRVRLPLLQRKILSVPAFLTVSATQGALQYFKIFARTMQREWFGIDKLRLDKFMMLARRVLHQVYAHLQKTGW